MNNFGNEHLSGRKLKKEISFVSTENIELRVFCPVDDCAKYSILQAMY
jgi:hypothetical protein